MEACTGGASNSAGPVLSHCAHAIKLGSCCFGALSLAADNKGALLCYEGLAELLAFLGKVWRQRRRSPSAAVQPNAAAVQPSFLQCSHHYCGSQLQGCPAVALPAVCFSGGAGDGDLRTQLSACLHPFCLQAPQARSIFQQGASQRPPSARFLRQWATFEKREADLEVGSLRA
jgi:hypothetical protein